MNRLEIKPQYKEIATKCLYTNERITREDIESLNLFNTHHITKMMELNQRELTLLILDIITRKSVVTY